MLWYALCVVYGDLAVASHNRRRERKSSLSCQNFFFGIFSISGSLKPCICFPLVASVNMMRFFIIIFKYCILNEKPHSLNGLINWCYLPFLPHVLFFHSFYFFFSLIHVFETALLMHTSFNVFPCVWYCTNKSSVWAQVCHELCPAHLCAGNRTLEVPGTRWWKEEGVVKKH